MREPPDDEILFRARLHPQTPVARLDPARVGKLYRPKTRVARASSRPRRPSATPAVYTRSYVYACTLRAREN
jgi:formamidopyrimidine-DNA glycosylase